MFDFVRKHNRLMMLVLFLLIVPSFVLVFGLERYNSMRDKGEVVARVDGRDITKAEWDAAHKSEVDRLRQSMPNLDAKLLDSPQARYATLERLVRERVLAAAAEDEHLVATDQRLVRELENRGVASLRGPDGKLDMERYRQLLAAQGQTPESFENQVRYELATRQVMNGVSNSGIATAAQANVSLGALFERREVQIARFSTADYATKVTPSEAELEAFYKANPQLFQAPEQAGIEYVVLDLDTVSKGITVNEQELKTYYDNNASRLSGTEERRASHILIAAAKDAPAAERQKAKAKAEELLAQAKKNPDSFAELAKKNSQDPGSAAQGGDLDFFARGAMTKPFEDAAFAMKKGDIAGPVETEFGYHIIKLTDIKAPPKRSYEELRPSLEADFKKQQAQRKFAEVAETFSNSVYEQSDSLKPVADKLKLEIKTAQNVGRLPVPGMTGPLANPKFLQALFSPDAIEKKRNTDALEIGPSQLVSGRITQYSPARTKPFAEVKEQVRQRVLAQRGAELAKKEGQEKLAAWKAAPASATLPAAIVLSRDEPAGQPRDLVEAVMRADAAALPALVGVDLGADGYAIAKVNKTIARPAPAQGMAQQELQQYNRWWTSGEMLAYYDLLKERFKARIEVPKPGDQPE